MLGFVLVIIEILMLVLAFFGMRKITSWYRLRKISETKRGGFVVLILFLISVGFLFVSDPIPSPEDNSIEVTRTNIPYTFEFTIIDDVGYLHSVDIYCEYFAEYVVGLNCYFDFYKDDVFIKTIQVTILSVSPYQQVESGSSRDTLAPGTYSVTFSYTESFADERTVSFRIRQREVRPTVDSDIQAIFKMAAVVFCFALICIGNFDIYTKSHESDEIRIESLKVVIDSTRYPAFREIQLKQRQPYSAANESGVLFQQGIACYSTGDYKGAIEAMNLHLESQPNDFRARSILLNSLAKLGYENDTG